MRVKCYTETKGNVYSFYDFEAPKNLDWEHCMCLARMIWEYSQKDATKVRVYNGEGKGKYIKIEKGEDFYKVLEYPCIKLRGRLSSPEKEKYILHIENNSNKIVFYVENACFKTWKREDGKPLTMQDKLHFYDVFMNNLWTCAYSLCVKRAAIRDVLETIEGILSEFAATGEVKCFYNREIYGEKVNLTDFVRRLRELFPEKVPPLPSDFDMYDVFQEVCSPNTKNGDEYGDEEDESEGGSDV